MAKKKKWIKGAVKRPGALRKKAKKRGLVKGNEPLSATDLKKLAKNADKRTVRQVSLARTLKKMRKKK